MFEDVCFRKVYHQQQSESDPFFIPPPEAVTLTETQVVRETLWYICVFLLVYKIIAYALIVILANVVLF